jgi:hypothetical protein
MLFNNFPPPPLPARKLENKQQKAAQHPNHIRANDKRRQRAVAKYKAAMGDEWVKTFEIGRRLGTQSGSLQYVLRTWLSIGLIERRKADKGYEWRML